MTAILDQGAALSLTNAQSDELRLLEVLTTEPMPYELALIVAGLKAEHEPVRVYHRHLLYQAVRAYQTARYVERDGRRGLVLTGTGEARISVLKGQQ